MGLSKFSSTCAIACRLQKYTLTSRQQSLKASQKQKKKVPQMMVVITLTILHTRPVVLSPPPKFGSHVKTDDTTCGPRGYEDIDYS